MRTPWRFRRELRDLPGTLSALAGLARLRGEAERARDLAAASAILSDTDVDGRREFVRLVCTETRPPHGFGAGAADDIRRIVTDGSADVLDAERARLAPDLARLLAVPGVTLDDVVAVHRRTGAITAGDLAAAVGTIGHPGADLDETWRLRIEAALPAIREGHPRMPLGRAVAILDRACERIRCVESVRSVEPSGSVRRFEPTVGDLEVLVSAAEPSRACASIDRVLDSPTALHRGADRLSLVLEGEPVTIRVVEPPAFPFALIFYTGSAAHVRALQGRAVHRGWRLTATAVHGTAGQPPPELPSEQAVYDLLGLAYVPPELRHGDWELGEAANGSLPDPIERRHIRGDLHVHTLWSDGRDSVEMVARAAQSLRYEYVAITDHSQRAAASRVLTLERLERQMDDVASVRRRVAGITILQGAEVDILPDGSLDFPDPVLERLDIVLASLHEPAGQGPDTLLERYVNAMRHPRVHIITHPANRLVGRDDGYRLDYEALFEVAARTGTVLEVDGGPGHLDLDGHLARRAVAAGVTISIDSDCHNVLRLARQMHLGVGTARRGGVERHHVINARPLEDVRAHFAAKPARLREAAR